MCNHYIIDVIALEMAMICLENEVKTLRQTGDWNNNMYTGFPTDVSYFYQL